MKLAIKLLAVAGIVWAAILVDRRLRKTPGATGPGADVEPDASTARSADTAAIDADIIIGIAEIDPEPLTQVSGEGIDLDATETAHRAPRDQRERMPVRGKNIP